MLFGIIIILFAIFALSRTYLQFKNSHISLHWFTLWSFIWFTVIIVAIIPDSTTTIANAVGIGRGADMLIYTTILILLYGFYRLIIGQEKQRKELTELTRRIAINSTKSTQSKK